MQVLMTMPLPRYAKALSTPLWLLFLLTALMLGSLPTFTSAFTIGEECGGGVVCYVNASGKHGLIVSRTDLKGHSPGCPEGFFTWDDAQLACRNYVSCDYNDWILPSKEQLNKLYLHKSDLGPFSVSYNHYWSSSVDKAGNVWVQGFGGGFQVLNFKTNANRVRAIRVF